MPRTTFPEFMALMQSTGADKSIRAIATAYRVESPEYFFSSVVESLYQTWSTGKPIHNFRAWAKRAARNAAENERKSATRQRSSHVSFEVLEETDSLLSAGGADSLDSSTPSERFDALTELNFIFGAIKSLPLKERDAICNLLERICGDRPEEHLSEAERKALYRARKALKESLESSEHTAADSTHILFVFDALEAQADPSTDWNRRFLRELSRSNPERDGDVNALFRQLISGLRDGESSSRQSAHGKTQMFISRAPWSWKKRR
ncbi:sigma-70 family RNA polymerase sigma factor [Archangium gephyra]|nr:sigma-70 family RNA polymerase sigma factor [Archangium gephyra]